MGLVDSWNLWLRGSRHFWSCAPATPWLNSPETLRNVPYYNEAKHREFFVSMKKLDYSREKMKRTNCKCWDQERLNHMVAKLASIVDPRVSVTLYWSVKRQATGRDYYLQTRVSSLFALLIVPTSRSPRGEWIIAVVYQDVQDLFAAVVYVVFVFFLSLALLAAVAVVISKRQGKGIIITRRRPRPSNTNGCHTHVILYILY